MAFSSNKKGFGLTEVIVSAVILAAVIAGFFATFVGVRNYINKSNRRIIAANYIRSGLSFLYNQVRQDTWDSSYLKAGNHPFPVSINTPNYSGDYSVTDSGGYRQVTININYPVD
ncbi:MAG: hypothetical protein DRP55_09645 [Spirochaetes bacterium]|nr:MAG: hypothetical protein DRP55_09645 [Spirochaetota bacterium]